MLADTQALRDDVRKDVAKVRAAYDEGLKAIADTPAASGITSMQKVIDDWAKRGQDAADNNKLPSPKGWPGWQSAGQTYLNGIADISKLGKTYKLDAIVDTIRDIPKNAPKDIQNAAHSKAIKTVASAVADYTNVSTIMDLYSLPWKYLGAGFAALYIYRKFKGKA